MGITEVEAKIEKDLTWKSVADMPDFPFASFRQLSTSLEQGDSFISVNSITARQWAPSFGKPGAILLLLLGSLTIVVPVASIVLALVMRNYWLLAGVPISIIGQLAGSPYNSRKKGVLSRFAVVLAGLAILALIDGRQTVAALIAIYIISYWGDRSVYGYSVHVLRKIVSKRESLFLYFYQQGKIFLQPYDSLGDFEASASELNQANRDVLRKQRELGLEYLRQGMLADAILAFREGIALEQEAKRDREDTIRRARSVASQRNLQGDFEIRINKATEHSHSREGEWQYNLGACYALAGQRQEALKQCKELSELGGPELADDLLEFINECSDELLAKPETKELLAQILDARIRKVQATINLTQEFSDLENEARNASLSAKGKLGHS